MLQSILEVYGLPFERKQLIKGSGQSIFNLLAREATYQAAPQASDLSRNSPKALCIPLPSSKPTMYPPVLCEECRTVPEPFKSNPYARTLTKEPIEIRAASSIPIPCSETSVALPKT